MKSQSDYLKKRIGGLKFLIRTPKRKFGQNRFHLLRVETKKLKAILYRMEFLLSDFDRKKFYKPFRKLFAHAGRVREIQIEKDILKTHGQPDFLSGYLNQLDKNIRKERSRFFKIRNLRLNSKIEKRLKKLGHKAKEIETLDSGPFIAGLFDEIKSLVGSGTLEEKSAHELRKKLKNLKYNLECLEEGKFNTNHPKQEELAQLLGSWHDLVTVHQAIQIQMKEAPIPVGEQETLKKINRKIKSKAAELFKEITHKTSDFDDFHFSAKPKKKSLR